MLQLGTTVSPTALTPGTYIDWAPTGGIGANAIRVSLSGAVTLVSLTGGVAGRLLVLENTSALYSMVIAPDDGASGTAAMRFLCPNGAPVTVGPLCSVTLFYDATSARWYVQSGSAAVSAYTTFDIYVDAVSGNDANSGVSSAAPIQTYARALQLLPTTITGVTRVHFASGTYTWSAMPPKKLLANLWLIGDGAGQGVQTGYTPYVATSAAAGSGFNVIVSTVGGLFVNDYRGMTIIVKTGAAAGDRRTVRNNGTNTFVPSRPFSAAVGAGDLFTVVDTNVLFTLSGDNVLTDIGAPAGALAPPYGPNFYMENIGFTAASNATLYLRSCRVVAHGVRLMGAAPPAVSLSCAALHAGMDDSSWQASGAFADRLTATIVAPVSVNSWAGWGLSSIELATIVASVSCSENGMAGGYFVANGLSSVRGGGTLAIRGGSLKGYSAGASSLQLLQGGEASIAGAAGTPTLVDSTVASAILVADQSTLSGLANATVTSSSGAAVECTSGRASITPSGVTGSGSTFGVLSRLGGRVTITGAPTLTGPAGADISVDNVTAIANATLAAQGDATFNSADGSCVQRTA